MVTVAVTMVTVAVIEPKILILDASFPRSHGSIWVMELLHKSKRRRAYHPNRKPLAVPKAHGMGCCSLLRDPERDDVIAAGYMLVILMMPYAQRQRQRQRQGRSRGGERWE